MTQAEFLQALEIFFPPALLWWGFGSGFALVAAPAVWGVLRRIFMEIDE